jgi:hypothetical protein
MHKDRKKRTLEGKGGGSVGKVGVQGMLKPGGKIRAKVLEIRSTSLWSPTMGQR